MQWPAVIKAEGQVGWLIMCLSRVNPDSYAYKLYVRLLIEYSGLTLNHHHIACITDIQHPYTVSADQAMATFFDFSQAPGYLIRRSHQTSMAIFAEELAAYDVTALQFAIMQTLVDEPGADQITVAQRVALDAATSGSVIMRLEERGWLRREASSSDKRRKLLWLTAEGQKIALEMKKPARKVQQRLLETLNDAEKDQFVAMLKKVARISE
jgi:MarR family transcriptional regulator, lower aerobic nicotinate degradation pathway regulator